MGVDGSRVGALALHLFGRSSPTLRGRFPTARASELWRFTIPKLAVGRYAAAFRAGIRDSGGFESRLILLIDSLGGELCKCRDPQKSKLVRKILVWGFLRCEFGSKARKPR